MPFAEHQLIQKLTAWLHNFAVNAACNRFYDASTSEQTSLDALQQTSTHTSTPSVIWLSLDTQHLNTFYPNDYLTIPTHHKFIVASFYINDANQLILRESRIWPALFILLKHPSHEQFIKSIQTEFQTYLKNNATQNEQTRSTLVNAIAYLQSHYTFIKADKLHIDTQPLNDISALNNAIDTDVYKLHNYQTLIKSIPYDQHTSLYHCLNNTRAHTEQPSAHNQHALHWALELQYGSLIINLLENDKKHTLISIDHTQLNAVYLAHNAIAMQQYLDEFKLIAQSGLQFNTSSSLMWKHKPLTIHNRISVLSSPSLGIIKTYRSQKTDITTQINNQNINQYPSIHIENTSDLLHFLTYLTGSNTQFIHWFTQGHKLPSLHDIELKKQKLLDTIFITSNAIREYRQIKLDQSYFPNQIKHLENKIDKYALIVVEKVNEITRLDTKIEQHQRATLKWENKILTLRGQQKSWSSIKNVFLSKKQKYKHIRLLELMEAHTCRLQNQISKFKIQRFGIKASCEAMRTEQRNFEQNLADTQLAHRDSIRHKQLFLKEHGESFNLLKAFTKMSQRVQDSSFETQLTRYFALAYRTTTVKSHLELMSNLKTLKLCLEDTTLNNSLSHTHKVQLLQALTAVCPNLMLSESVYFEYFDQYAEDIFQKLIIETEASVLRLNAFYKPTLPLISAPALTTQHLCYINNAVYTTPVHPYAKPVKLKQNTPQVSQFA